MPPGATGSSRKDFEKTNGSEAIENSAMICGITCVTLSTVAVKLLVVDAYVPSAAPAGTRTSTAMVQLPFAGTVPPMKMRKVVPDSVPPQVLVVAGPTAARPVRAVDKPSVNTTLVIALTGSVFCKV